jgi:gamma-glutamylcysteine synthetase
MRSRAEELIYHHFIDKFLGKTERYVGIEIEMPLINLNKQAVEPEFAKAIVELLVDSFEFRPTYFTLDGYPIEAVNNNGDTFSFDTSINTLEFAMGKKRSINEIAESFYTYLGALKKLEKTHNYLICGMGTNPYMEYANSKPLNTPSMMAKSEFLKKFTTHHDGEIFHAFSAATQTHLDVRLTELPDLLNLWGKLAFVDGMLFANSLPFPHEPGGDWQAKLPLSLQSGMQEHTLCFRDTLWHLCEAPNTKAYDQEYTSVEGVVNHLMELKLFVVSDGKDGLKPIEPVEFSQYFADNGHSEQDIECFRSLEPIAVSKHGTIEIRQTCTQPLAEIFVPTAFYTGISENYKKAVEVVHDFWRENQIEMSNSELRRKAVRQETIAAPEKMNAFITNLLDISVEGLKKRNFGEEKYLGCLINGDHFMECPAKRQIRLLREGWEYQDIILAYSEMDVSEKTVIGNDKIGAKGAKNGLSI